MSWARFPYRENAAYAVRGDKGRDVRHRVVADGRVGGTVYLALRHHIPQRDAVRGDERLFCGVVRGQGRGVILRQSAPKSVLRMAVVEVGRARLHAGEAAQDERVAALREIGLETFHFHALMLAQKGKNVNRRRGRRASHGCVLRGAGTPSEVICLSARCASGISRGRGSPSR